MLLYSENEAGEPASGTERQMPGGTGHGQYWLPNIHKSYLTHNDFHLFMESVRCYSLLSVIPTGMKLCF